MKLRVLGCHGGASKDHRNVSFLIDERVALDAGSVASALSVAEQGRLEVVLVTHAHMDHVAELGTITELRAQDGGETLLVQGLPETIEALRAHYFNDVLWPDFTRIVVGGVPTLELRAIEPEAEVRLGGLRVQAIPVHHTVPSCGFVVLDGDGRSLAYTGDTGPTDRFWEVLNGLPDLGAVITEVSFPDRMADLAKASGHLTPGQFREQVGRIDSGSELPILVYGMKPLFAEEIASELQDVGVENVRLLESGDVFEL